MKKKSVFTFILVMTIGAVAFSGCEKKSELQKITLNEVVHSIFYAPQYVAIEKGFFAEEGLDVTLETGQGADKSMTALISGEADIALLGTEAGIYVYNEGKTNHAIAFAQLTQRAGNYLVSRYDEGNFNWDSVRGKTIIGGRIGGMPQMILEYVLKTKNIEIGKDVEIVTNLQFTSTAGAFIGGVGDYTAEFDPSASAIEDEGKGYVVAAVGQETGKVPYTVYMATKDYIVENPSIIQKFTNAIYKGQLWVQNHSAGEIAEAVASHFKESELDSLKKMIQRYRDSDVWTFSPTFDEDAFNLIQDIMENGEQLDKRVPFSALVDNKFANEAVKDVR